MIFNSIRFVEFFLVVYAAYRMLPHRGQNWLLVGASYVFYGAWNWRFLGLLWASTVVDFFVARYLARAVAPGRRRLALVLSLTFNLSMLGVFKYFNFFAGSLATMFGWLGWRLDYATLNVVLPIGISFYTFMTMSYVIDVYRREIEPADRFFDFALFVAYFPHLVAGPILRASLLLPQIQKPRRITAVQIQEGLWLLAWGYFQKMFVADNLAPLVDTVFGPAATPHGLDVLLAVYAFALQIYGDFAGYSNIARGLSKLMGIELNVNFLFPYFVRTPQEFWRHWHISLSTWLRDYLYIPLGGSRGSRAATRRNLMLTMVLGGLWHGAAWTFVLWGTYQGLMLVIYRALGEWRGRGRAAASDPARTEGFAGHAIAARFRWWHVPAAVWMFQITCAGWLIFRAESVAQLRHFTALLVTDLHASANTVPSLLVPLLAYAGPLLVVHAYQARKGTELAMMSLPRTLRYVLAGALIYLIVLFGDFEGARFIYFQF